MGHLPIHEIYDSPDVFVRRIVGWSVAARQVSNLMFRALQMALTRRQPSQVVHHSDHGSPYIFQHFLEVCQRANMQVSMGSVGDCYDDAMAESFFETLETELIHQQPRLFFKDRAQTQAKIFDYAESAATTLGVGAHLTGRLRNSF